MNLTRVIRLGAMTAVVMTLMSCSNTKTRLPYFEDITSLKVDGELSNSQYNVKIRPDDELAITVTSIVPSATAAYNLPQVNIARGSELEVSGQIRQQSYLVSPQGTINFPVLGKIYVAGLTTSQLADELTERISKDVEDPMVNVRIVNFHVNVLGEVKLPGLIEVKSERFSVIDALSAAGDLSEYGERSNVIVVREENGQKTYHHLNLNDSKSLESPYYYLQQNDWVYVSPNNVRQANSKYNQFNSYKISVISTVVSACSVIATLVIALVIR